LKRKRKLSDRLIEVVEALPLKPGIRVLEIGCGTGAAAREIANRIPNGHILGIDRSRKAIELAIKTSMEEIGSGRLSYRQVAIENFKLEENELPYNLAVAIRVGALDGRHPEAGQLAQARIAKALTVNGKLFIDGGKPLKEIPLLIHG
jgi:SAM-dependent methyltransferase